MRSRASPFGFLCTAVFALAIVAMALGGCANTTPAQQAPLITFAAQASTSAALVAISNPADRVAAARATYDIATAVKDAASTTSDLTAVDAIAEKYLAQWNSPYAPIVGGAVKTVDSLVSWYLDQYWATASTDAKVAALQVYLTAAFTGVANGALPYTQGVPVTTPPSAGVTVSRNKGQTAGAINVVAHTWR